MADNKGSRLRNGVVSVLGAIGSALLSVAVFSRAVSPREKPEEEPAQVPGQQPAASGRSSARVSPLLRLQANESQGAAGNEVAKQEPATDEETHSPYGRPIITGGDHVSYPLVASRPGYSIPEPKEIPRPTYWPVVMALAITFLAWGFVTSIIVAGIGVILFAISLAGWIGEIQYEQHEHGNGHEER